MPYVAVKPNAAGRLEVPILELEVALLDDWVRFWFRDELVPLPGQMFNQLKTTTLQLLAAEDQLAASKQAQEESAAELARLRAELDRLRGEES